MTLEDHCRMQQRVADHARHRGYSPVLENVLYEERIGGIKYKGEVDVLAYCQQRQLWYFYEIKSNPNKYDRAKEQYKRFCKAHPSMIVEGVFYCPRGSKRL